MTMTMTKSRLQAYDSYPHDEEFTLVFLKFPNSKVFFRVVHIIDAFEKR